jgi:hypothetical protein
MTWYYYFSMKSDIISKYHALYVNFNFDNIEICAHLCASHHASYASDFLRHIRMTTLPMRIKRALLHYILKMWLLYIIFAWIKSDYFENERG